MNKKKIIIPVFIVVALVQLYFPAKMILDNEDVIETGTEYKFKTQPIDPYDPFRGKYITLNYEDDYYKLDNDSLWRRNNEVYVYFKTDSLGYAIIDTICKEKQSSREDYLKTKISYSSTHKGLTKVFIQYPFYKFFMEESKAYDAELAYRASRRDTTKTTYGLVSIKNGNAVLKDVLINNKPIREVVLENQNKLSE